MQHQFIQKTLEVLEEYESICRDYPKEWDNTTKNILINRCYDKVRESNYVKKSGPDEFETIILKKGAKRKGAVYQPT